MLYKCDPRNNIRYVFGSALALFILLLAPPVGAGTATPIRPLQPSGQ